MFQTIALSQHFWLWWMACAERSAFQSFQGTWHFYQLKTSKKNVCLTQLHLLLIQHHSCCELLQLLTQGRASTSTPSPPPPCKNIGSCYIVDIIMNHLFLLLLKTIFTNTMYLTQWCTIPTCFLGQPPPYKRGSLIYVHDLFSGSRLIKRNKQSNRLLLISSCTVCTVAVCSFSNWDILNINRYM